MATGNTDLVVRVAANIQALQTDMERASASIKSIETATTGANASTTQFTGLVERLTERFAALELIHGAFDFAKDVIVSTARLEELSLATGIATDAIQQMAYVGKEFGVDSEQMARGVEQLSAKLANGDASATSAVQELGLSVKDLLAAGPEDAFLQIAEAVGKVEDPMLKNGLAAELFGGKLAKVLIPMLSELRTKMAEVPKDAVISKENITAAHDFEVGLEHLKTRLEAWTAIALGGVVAYERWLEGPKAAAKAVDEHSKSLEENREAEVRVTSAADLLANKLSALRTAALEPLTAAQQAEILELESYGENQKNVAKLVGASEVAVKLYTDAHKAATAAAKEAARVEAAGLLEVTKLWDEYFALRTTHGGTANAIAIAQIDQWAEDLTAKMVKAGTDTNEFYEGLAAVSKEKMAGVGIDWTLFKTRSISALQETADNALATYNAMADSGEFFRADLDAQLQKYHQLQDAARGFGDSGVDAIRRIAAAQALKDAADAKAAAAAAAAKANLEMGNTYDIGHAARDPEIMKLLHDGWSLENAEALNLARQWGFQAKTYDKLGNLETTPSKGERVPGYETGGPTVPGLSMLHGGEYVVPKAGALVSSGSGGGPQVINLVVDGRVLASIVNDHNTKTLKQSRQWPSA